MIPRRRWFGSTTARDFKIRIKNHGRTPGRITDVLLNGKVTFPGHEAVSLKYERAQDPKGAMLGLHGTWMIPSTGGEAI